MKSFKVVLFVALFSCIGSFVQAQVINIPAKAKEHFLKTYPSAKEADWSNNVSNYTVKFKNGGATMRGHYRMDGTWNFTETLMSTKDIPAAVKASYDKSRFADWNIESVTRVDNDNKQHLYRIEAKKGVSKEFVFYDKKGKEVKTSLSF